MARPERTSWLARCRPARPRWRRPAADPSADLFKPTGLVLKFEISVDKPNLDQLRREPRKYVRCTLKVGDQTFKDVGIHLKGAAGCTATGTTARP